MGIFINFFRKMSALSAQRHVLRSIIGLCGPIFMMSVGLGGGVKPLRLALVDPRRAGIFAKNRRCLALAGRLTLAGPAAAAWRGTRREGQHTN